MKSQSMIQAITLALVSATLVNVGFSSSGGGSAYANPYATPSGTPSKARASKGGSNTGGTNRSSSIKDILEARASRGGTNTGGTNRGSSIKDVLEWCTNSVSTLQEAQDAASTDILGSDYDSAVTHFSAGLVAAIANATKNGYENTLTSKAMTRILDIADALETLPESSDEPRAKRISDFYIMGYEYIIRIAKDLDRPIYIPYYYGNSKFDVRAYERRFADYGVQQIKWVLDGFTYGSSAEYYARDFEVYMKIAEEITKGVAADLSDSIFGVTYACQISDLEVTGLKIAKYNAGDHNAFGGASVQKDKVYAINTTVKHLKETVEALGHSCNGNY